MGGTHGNRGLYIKDGIIGDGQGGLGGQMTGFIGRADGGILIWMGS